MASETMESAIMMEVASIRRYIEMRFTEEDGWSSKDFNFIKVRLDSIEQTLNEEDPR